MINRFCVLMIFFIWCVDYSQQKPERCLLPPESGMCMARIPRLYYDKASNSCQEFVYGGCQGNDNNFETLKDCDDICVRETTTVVLGDRCSLLPEGGECRASIPRVYYNRDTQTCLPFTYGGCGGNDNNFESTELCQAACATNTTHQEVDCNEKPDVGPCRGRLPRLYYDAETKSCKEFFYGGCQGNSNNFESVEECDRACVSLTRPGASYCYLPQQVGPCKASIPKFYFEPSNNSCKQFTYGGCEGNDNKFDTLEECERNCLRKTAENICELKPDAGFCKALLFRYYYDSETQTCGEFRYGGCGGNENNFETLEECEDRCGNHASVSLQTSFVVLIVLVSHIFGKDILSL